MLGDRQEFDMGEAEIANISGKLVRQFAVGQPAPAFLRAAAPRSKMNFVDRDWRGQSVGIGWRRLRADYPVDVNDDGRGLRPLLAFKSHRI